MHEQDTLDSLRSERVPLWYIVALTAGVLSTVWIGYGILNWRNQELEAAGQAMFMIPTFIDNHIPFIADFAYFYYSYYVILLYIAMTAYTNKLRFQQAVTGIFFLSIASIFFWTVIPSKMIRPDISSCISFSCAWIKGIYEADPGYNIMPSLHTGHSVYVMLLAWHYNRKHFPLIAFLGCGIIASTVLIKQHYFADLPPGILLGFIGFYVGDTYAVPLFSQAKRLVSSTTN